MVYLKNIIGESILKGTLTLTMAVGVFLFSTIFAVAFAFNLNNAPIVTGTGNLTMIISRNVHFIKPENYKDITNLSDMGTVLAPEIMQTARFKELANGNVYHINPYSSFGYTWGPGMPSSERIIFFAPNNASYIIVDLYVSNSTIHDMYYTSRSNVSFGSSVSNNWGGYGAKYCNSGSPCNSNSSLTQVYGNVTVPSTLTGPLSATHACCVFGEWTGITGGPGSGNFVQGGIVWGGYNQTSAVKNANTNGFALFVQQPPNSATFILPPSWMNGVQGQTIALSTLANGNCATGGLLWVQEWKEGSSSTSQYMGCSGGNDYYGWYIFESPAGCNGSGCYNFTDNGKTVSVFQLPEFSGSAFTGYLCGSSFSCRPINSNNDPVGQFFLYHRSEDVVPSTISGANSWIDAWISSN